MATEPEIVVHLIRGLIIHTFIRDRGGEFTLFSPATVRLSEKRPNEHNIDSARRRRDRRCTPLDGVLMNGSLPWFRMHTHILDNHKIHALPADIFRTWVMLLALARRNGGVLPSVTRVTKSNDSVTKSVTKSVTNSVTGSVTLDAEKCAFALRCVTDIVTEHVTHLVTVGLIDVTEDGLIMHDWEEHQQEPGGIRKQALSNAERQRAFRERRAHTVTESNEKVTARNEARNEKVTDASRARSESVSVISSVLPAPDARAIEHNAPAREAGRNGARSVVVAAEVVSETDQEIRQTAERLSSRHPSVRSCSVSVTRNLLGQICDARPERERLPTLRRIDQCHERWCASGEWTRESGRYAKPLRKWLDPEQEAWTVDAPVMDTNGAGASAQSTVKAMEIFLRSKNAR